LIVADHGSPLGYGGAPPENMNGAVCARSGPYSGTGSGGRTPLSPTAARDAFIAEVGTILEIALKDGKQKFQIFEC